MRLILWDVDGTLLRAGPVAREVFDDAVTQTVGMPPGRHGVPMSGKTDPQIAREILASMGVPSHESDAHLPGILDRLEQELAAGSHRIRSEGHVLPGVLQVLQHLHREPDVVQSLLTGNVAGNAATKVSSFGLDAWIDLAAGAYGSDDPDRAALVPIATQRTRSRYGRAPEPVWVIGDTPNDLACAQAGGARCVLVATGRFGMEDLRHLPADAVWPDLSDTDRVLELLLS